MLVRFTVSNWKSFKDPTSLSLVAGKEKQHSDHIQYVPEYKLNILPIALVYGGNASGKSNLVKALDFASRLIVSTNFDPYENIPIDFFRLCEECANKPSTFDFDLVIDEKLYHYYFALFQSKIVEESLTRLTGKRATVLFDRKNEKFDFHYKLPKEIQQHFSSTLANKLALSSAVTKQIEGMDEIKAIYDWFRFSLVILTPHSRLIRFNEQNLPTRELSYALNKIDTGISCIKFEELPVKSCGLEPDDMERINKFLLSGAPVVWFTNVMDDFCKFELRNNEIVASKMVSYHKNEKGENVRFEIQENSDGTRRCLHLFPAFNAMIRPNSTACYVIDELDRSLHTNLVKQLLVSFLETRNQDTRSQLIFTNHDVMQMDQNVLRRDEIWMAERNPASGASSLTALHEYEYKDQYIRKDHSLPKLYLEGGLGGIPYLDSFGGLFTSGNDGENEDEQRCETV